MAGPAELDVRGRDVRRSADGEADLVDEIALTIQARPGGQVTGAVSRTGRTAPELDGVNLRRALGRTLAAALPADAAGRSLLYSTLEDLNGAFLVSGYSPLRRGLMAPTRQQAAASAAMQQDVCAGWAEGGPVLALLRDHAVNAVPMGPVAPPMIVAPDRWHPLGEPRVHAVRRVRCLDVWHPRGAPSEAAVRAHFRDSYFGQDEESVMHEYLVHARLEGPQRIVAEIVVEPRVLPWESCPSAVTSAERVVGVAAAEIPERVRAELHGPPTCTHLNSTLRSLADVSSLLAALHRDAPA